MSTQRNKLYLRYLAEKGAHERYGGYDGIVEERIRQELDTIYAAGFEDYFLVVADILRFCRDSEIPTGPGRGSVCGSAVAFACYITDVDPIVFGIPFERFLHLERVAQPDIDLDICQARRQEVVEYLRTRYGRDNVAQIITFGTLLAKQVTKDVCRVLHVDDHLTGQRGNATGDRLASLIPEGGGADQVRLKDFVESPEGESFGRDIGRLRVPYQGHEIGVLDTALRLEGIRRHESVHAAGVVICDRPIIEVAPLYRKNQQAEVSIQYDMKDAEEIGLLKMDVLGLRTVTVIGDAEKLIRRHVPDFTIKKVPLDDKATFELLGRGDTGSVFQLEGEGITGACTGLRPDRFEDIIALIALYRPGPMEQLPNYIHRKHGKEEVVYAHVDLEPILNRTYGLIVYQEQVIGIARVFAGFTPGEADLFRKAIGKKDLKLIAEEIDKFKTRSIERGYERELVERIAEQIAYFGRYGFNLGHATGYGFITYWTAYLKANYPVEFFTAELNSIGEAERISRVGSDAAARGIKLLPPDINTSGVGFVPADESSIRYGLGAIKGLGETTVQLIIEERDSTEKSEISSEAAKKTRTDGTEYAGRVRVVRRVANDPHPYADLYDFCRRLPSVPTSAKSALVTAGAFGTDPAYRRKLLSALDAINANAKKGKPIDIDGGEWHLCSDIELIRAEKEILGFYLSSHPLDFHGKDIARYGAVYRGAFESLPTICTVAGIVTGIRTHIDKNGKEMAWVSLETMIDDMPDVTVFGSYWSLLKEKAPIEKNQILIVEGKRTSHTKFGKGFSADRVTVLDRTRPRAEMIVVSIDSPDMLEIIQLASMAVDSGGVRVALVASEEGRKPLLTTNTFVNITGEILKEMEAKGWEILLDHLPKHTTELIHGVGQERMSGSDLDVSKMVIKRLGGKVIGEIVGG